MWITAAILALSAATTPVPVSCFVSLAPLTVAKTVPTAGDHAVGFAGPKTARLWPVASMTGQQEGGGQRPKILHPTKQATRNKKLDIGIISVEDDDCDLSRLRRVAYYVLQVPLYAVKFPFAIALGIWSSLVWRAPTESDVVNFVENTGLIIVLHRGNPPGEQPLDDTFEPASTNSNTNGKEQRRYYVDVQKCSLDHVTRSPGKELVTPINSWAMSYTKTRPIANHGSGSRPGAAGKGEWETHIDSFVVNGKPVVNPACQMSFLHLYSTMGSHTKSHVYGNTLVQRINKDQALRDKLMESTWNTIWLHHGLLRGGLGPMTAVRTEGNKWRGLGSPCRSETLVAESLDMSSLGGCQHGLAQRWVDLDLPLSQYMLQAREGLRRVMLNNDIPMELLEAVFLSVVMHTVDHVLGSRYMWGLKFELDLWEEPPRRPLVCESAVWNFMWATPTINPLYDNKIRRIPKPFYRQLYKEMKQIDTMNVADEITASIMY